MVSVRCVGSATYQLALYLWLFPSFQRFYISREKGENDEGMKGQGNNIKSKNKKRKNKNKNKNTEKGKYSTYWLEYPNSK